jgi:acyl-CoA reductase-like NAD-dependent aldehyde dehydrogenase
VVSVRPFDDEREAVRLAGGRIAGVWTRDLARAHRSAAGIRAGRVYVNRDGGDDAKGVEAYTRVKLVRIDLPGR